VESSKKNKDKKIREIPNKEIVVFVGNFVEKRDLCHFILFINKQIYYNKSKLLDYVALSEWRNIYVGKDKTNSFIFVCVRNARGK